MHKNQRSESVEKIQKTIFEQNLSSITFDDPITIRKVDVNYDNKTMHFSFNDDKKRISTHDIIKETIIPQELIISIHQIWRIANSYYLIKQAKFIVTFYCSGFLAFTKIILSFFVSYIFKSQVLSLCCDMDLIS